MNPIDDSHPPLTPAEVARIFRVDPKTVSRWAKQGRLASFKTPGGHRRFRESDVRCYLTERQAEAAGGAR